MCCIEDYTCDVMINSLDFHKRKPAAFFFLEVFRVMNTNSSLNRSAFPQTDTSKILNCSHVNLTGSPCESHYSKSAARSANRHPVMVSCKCMSGSDHWHDRDKEQGGNSSGSSHSLFGPQADKPFRFSFCRHYLWSNTCDR